MSQKPQISRTEYLHFLSLPTRWMDNDVYGHVNNALYYAFFDTAINEYLIAEGGHDIRTGRVLAFAAESQCQYLSPLAFPGVIDIGLRVSKLGNSSVRYELAIFKQGESVAAAVGYFVHVFVDRETQRPVSMPATIRAALERLVLPALLVKSLNYESGGTH
ncbi:MAG TPA: thioesterase family protein [Pyrinomonadaceae bacterium]|nr:thioesterase family protein [Pyrinomonadaceae bacterium]